jgi:hypothetical protein
MPRAKRTLVVRVQRAVGRSNLRPRGAVRLDIASHRLLAQPCVLGNGRSYATGVTASAIEVELARNEPAASLAGAERQRRVGAVHLARLERKRTATLVSSVKSRHSRPFRERVRGAPLRYAPL